MFSLWCSDWVGSLYANRFLWVLSVLRVASGPRVKLVGRKSALTPLPPPPPHPPVYSTNRSKAVVPVLVLLFAALWFILRGYILRGYLFYVLPCVFSVILALRLPRLGKRELVLVLFVRLIDLRLFGFVCFLFHFVSGKAAVCDCGIPWTFLLPFFLTTGTSLLFRLCVRFFFFVCSRDVALVGWKPFTRTEQVSCVYHGRTGGEGWFALTFFVATWSRFMPPVKFCWPFQGGASAVVYDVYYCMSSHICLGIIFESDGSLAMCLEETVLLNFCL